MSNVTCLIVVKCLWRQGESAGHRLEQSENLGSHSLLSVFSRPGKGTGFWPLQLTDLRIGCWVSRVAWCLIDFDLDFLVVIISFVIWLGDIGVWLVLGSRPRSHFPGRRASAGHLSIFLFVRHLQLVVWSPLHGAFLVRCVEGPTGLRWVHSWIEFFSWFCLEWLVGDNLSCRQSFAWLFCFFLY